ADSRNMVSSGGSLYEVDDGGIYKLANPTAANPGANPAVQPEWSMLVGNLQDGELRSAAYDTLSGAYLAGAQDNGTPVQVFGTGGPNFVRGFYDEPGGDGGVVAVDDVTSRANGTASVRYYGSQRLGGFQQAWFDNTGKYLGSYRIKFTLNGAAVNNRDIFSFVQPFP